MDILNVVAGVVGILGFVFAVSVEYRARLARAREEANKQILEERFLGLQKVLVGTHENITRLIRRGDSDQHATVEEMQHLARLVRTEVACSLDMASGLGEGFHMYRYGKLLAGQSSALRSIDVKRGREPTGPVAAHKITE